ncbi:similar to mitochondrial chaperone Frataxin [Plenodomus lingam JN3]|uniref:ferroxidase n=2 Tax=Leptosphaeria maculans TaxID=5022 RepID=E4ZPX1_LEPMJ|nr:similar to mitochondrial chaperone Frataxin [Plenodomus lingam JN3]CBX93506.1 similar to mitochondrial chaperone Frataxin [Plenodomus lingam JN3]
MPVPSPANGIIARASIVRNVTTVRAFQSSTGSRSIMPDAENPAPKESEPIDEPKVATGLTAEEFHERADHYLNELVQRLEEAQEKDPGIEVDYSAGVLEVTLQENTFVLNKQPPNKQIWLSSPLSGPKRFDWVVSQEGMDFKEGGGVGDWIYLRDGSSLTEILRKELGVDVSVDDQVPR